MDNKMLSEALISMLGAGNVRTGELMKTHTTFRIGGACRLLCNTTGRKADSRCYRIFEKNRTLNILLLEMAVIFL